MPAPHFDRLDLRVILARIAPTWHPLFHSSKDVFDNPTALIIQAVIPYHVTAGESFMILAHPIPNDSVEVFDVDTVLHRHVPIVFRFSVAHSAPIDGVAGNPQ